MHTCVPLWTTLLDVKLIQNNAFITKCLIMTIHIEKVVFYVRLKVGCDYDLFIHFWMENREREVNNNKYMYTKTQSNPVCNMPQYCEYATIKIYKFCQSLDVAGAINLQKLRRQWALIPICMPFRNHTFPCPLMPWSGNNHVYRHYYHCFHHYQYINID